MGKAKKGYNSAATSPTEKKKKYGSFVLIPHISLKKLNLIELDQGQ